MPFALAYQEGHTRPTEAYQQGSLPVGQSLTQSRGDGALPEVIGTPRTIHLSQCFRHWEKY